MLHRWMVCKHWREQQWSSDLWSSSASESLIVWGLRKLSVSTVQWRVWVRPSSFMFLVVLRSPESDNHFYIFSQISLLVFFILVQLVFTFLDFFEWQIPEIILYHSFHFNVIGLSFFRNALTGNWRFDFNFSMPSGGHLGDSFSPLATARLSSPTGGSHLAWEAGLVTSGPKETRFW